MGIDNQKIDYINADSHLNRRSEDRLYKCINHGYLFLPLIEILKLIRQSCNVLMKRYIYLIDFLIVDSHLNGNRQSED